MRFLFSRSRRPANMRFLLLQIIFEKFPRKIQKSLYKPDLKCYSITDKKNCYY